MCPIDCYASLDAKRLRICRPGGDNNEHAAAYNDYYGFHNMGYQSIVAPDGMIVHFSGPFAGAGNDLNFLTDSRVLSNFLAALSRDNDMDDAQLDLVADEIYNLKFATEMSKFHNRKTLHLNNS